MHAAGSSVGTTQQLNISPNIPNPFPSQGHQSPATYALNQPGVKRTGPTVGHRASSSNLVRPSSSRVSAAGEVDLGSPSLGPSSAIDSPNLEATQNWELNGTEPRYWAGVISSKLRKRQTEDDYVNVASPAPERTELPDSMEIRKPPTPFKDSNNAPK